MRIITRSRRASGAILLLCAAVCGALVSVIASASPAYRSSVPANGATLAVAPTQVIITFSEETSATESNGVVTDAAGTAVSTGWSVALNARTTMTIPLRPNLGNGVYTVSYTARSDDGQTASGSFIFTVNPAVKPSASVTASTGRGAPWGPGLAILAALAIFVGGGLFIALRARRDYLAETARAAAAARDEPET